MGKENAGRLSEHFSRDELQAMVDVAATLPGLTATDIAGLVGEFGRNYESHAVHARRGELTRLLEDLKGDPDGGEGSKPRDSETSRPGQPEEAAVLEFFVREPPVYSAILINSLDDEVSARVLGQLEAGQRNAILDAYLSRKPLDPEIESEVASDLMELVHATEPDKGDAPQVEKAAQLINFFGEETADDLLGYIGGHNPELAAQIRRQIFRFPMVRELAKEHRALLFDAVEQEEIVAALSDADDEMKETVLETLSQRSRRLAEAELARGGISQERRERSQRKISAQAIMLARQGRIVLPGDAE